MTDVTSQATGTAQLPVAVQAAGSTPWKARGASGLRWVAALTGGLLVFGAFVLANGADPLAVLADIWFATLTKESQVQQIILRAAPFALAGLAVVVPAKAGMVNVGGEGQLTIGAVAAAGVALAIDRTAAPGLVVLLMLLAGAAAGAAWAGIAAVLRVVVKVNEAVTTLLLNYLALFVMLFLILGPWKDPSALGQSTSLELADAAKLPVLAGTRVHVGVVLTVVVALAVWFALTRTAWGFRLSVVGGNPEAARRAGIPVVTLLLSALLIGGALAGLAGFIHFAGAEYKLRPTFGVTIGYVAFLASWLARHRPLPLLLASLALAAIAVSGNSLQIGSGLPAASVNILMGLVLIAVLGWTGTRRARS